MPRSKSSGAPAKASPDKSFGVPAANVLKRPGAIKRIIKNIIDADAACDTFYRAYFHATLAKRYELALRVAADPELFKKLAKEPCVAKLARPPKKAADTLRAILWVTVGDSKKASKQFKRIEQFWIRGQPAAAVLDHLERYGMEKAVPSFVTPTASASAPASTPAPSPASVQATAGHSSNKGAGVRVGDLSGPRDLGVRKGETLGSGDTLPPGSAKVPGFEKAMGELRNVPSSAIPAVGEWVCISAQITARKASITQIVVGEVIPV